jgi:TonB family protein
MYFRRLGILLLLTFVCFSVFSPAQDDTGKPLKILRKPRPNYTEEARKHNVQGVVRVRVVFQSDGAIGEVSDVKENSEDARKYGLVAETIKAAKRIVFEPAEKDGKKVTVTKILEYNFTLY